MQDITHYSDDELSLIVFNTYYYYTLRHNFYALHQAVLDNFIFTDKQYDVMAIDVEEDLKEL